MMYGIVHILLSSLVALFGGSSCAEVATGALFDLGRMAALAYIAGG